MPYALVGKYIVSGIFNNDCVPNTGEGGLVGPPYDTLKNDTLIISGVTGSDTLNVQFPKGENIVMSPYYLVTAGYVYNGDTSLNYYYYGKNYGSVTLQFPKNDIDSVITVFSFTNCGCVYTETLTGRKIR